MLRFKPDDWAEGLLRPFILADPNGYVYIELQAPDLRFAALAMLTLLLVVARRFTVRDAMPLATTLAGLWLIFYVWVFVIGNGRYFMTGLLLAGPLTVAMLARAPFTRSMRLFLLAGLIGLQGMVVQQHFHHGAWALAHWTGNGPGLPLGDTPLRREPAVFLTTSNISHSILVPQFDPRSRWANIAGQINITPDKPEWSRLRRVLDTPLKKYVVLPILAGSLAGETQPTGEVEQMLEGALGRHGLRRTDELCEVLRSHLRMQNLASSEEATRPMAYWVCPLEGGLEPLPEVPLDGAPWLDAFTAVEQACPRFFPPGGGKLVVLADNAAVRHYVESDTRLYVDPAGNVMYRYLRALNPTRVGSVDEVRRGEFALDCEKLQGRYRYPWQQ